MTHDDDQQLLNEYRAASQQDAGSPPAHIRHSVLANAAAVARQRHKPANDSKYLWRAAAGVGVIGIALLLWRQSEPLLPATQMAREESATFDNAAPAAPATAAAAAEATPRAPTAATTTAKAAPPPALIAPSAAPTPPAASTLRTAPAAPAAEMMARSEAAATAPLPSQDRQQNLQLADADRAQPTELARAAAGSAERRTARSVSPQQLYQRHFAATTAAAANTGIAWMLLDSSDAVIDKGLVAATESLESLHETLATRHGVAISSWQLTDGVDAQGQTVRIAIAREL